MDHHLGPAVHILAVGIAGGRHQYGRNPHPQQHGPDRLGALVGERPPLGLRAGAVGMTDDRDRRLAVSIDHFGNRLKRRDSYTSAISPSHQRAAGLRCGSRPFRKLRIRTDINQKFAMLPIGHATKIRIPPSRIAFKAPPKLNITWEGETSSHPATYCEKLAAGYLCAGAGSKVPFRPRQRLVNSI